MNILILDVYPKTPYRISKDQNGAYGTANNYGDGFISRILRFIEENIYQKLESNYEYKINVRIIATTSKNIKVEF